MKPRKARGCQGMPGDARWSRRGQGRPEKLMGKYLRGREEMEGNEKESQRRERESWGLKEIQEEGKERSGEEELGQGRGDQRRRDKGRTEKARGPYERKAKRMEARKISNGRKGN